jgi:hypothetical protein
MPRVDALWLSRSAQALVARNTPPGEKAVVAAIGYQEPSLVFLLGRDTRLIKSGEGAAFLREHPDGLLLLGDNLEGEVLAALDRAGRKLQALGAVRGFNYSKGMWLTLTLYKAAAASPDGVGNQMDRAARPLPPAGPAG